MLPDATELAAHAMPQLFPSFTLPAQRLDNTKISCEDRAILALAGFVSFIFLLDRASVTPDQDDYQHHGS